MAARLCESAGAPLHGPICLSGTHRSYRQSSGRKTGPGLQNPVVLLLFSHFFLVLHGPQALVKSCTKMAVLMSVSCVASEEGKTADTALVRLLSCMRAHMAHQAGLLGKPCRT